MERQQWYPAQPGEGQPVREQPGDREDAAGLPMADREAVPDYLNQQYEAADLQNARGAGMDYDREPFARGNLRSPEEAQILERPSAERNVVFKFTPSARDSQISQPQEEQDFMEDQEAVVLARKPDLSPGGPRFLGDVLNAAGVDDEDILDEQEVLQSRLKQEENAGEKGRGQTSGQLIDAGFLDEEFQNVRHFSFNTKAKGENEDAMAQTMDPMKKCTSQLSQKKQTAKSKDNSSGEKRGPDAANQNLNKSKGMSSIDDSLNQRVSNPSLESQQYHQLFGPARADGSERDKRSDPFNAQNSPAVNGSSGGKNSKMAMACSATPSPAAINQELKNQQSPPNSKNRTQKSTSKNALGRALNQSHGSKGRALAQKLGMAKTTSNKPKGLTQSTRNAAAKANNFFRSPKQKVEHTKPNQKMMKASVLVDRTEGSEKNDLSHYENAGEAGQLFAKTGSNENADDLNDRVDSDVESPIFRRKSIKKKRDSLRTSLSKNVASRTKTRASKASTKKNLSSSKDADQSREFTSERSYARQGADHQSSLENSKIENEGALPFSPNMQSTPKQTNIFAVGHVRSTPSGQQSALSKVPRKQSIVEKHQAMKMKEAHDFLESQLNEQKARMKAKAIRSSPKNKNAPISAKLASLRGAQAVGDRTSSNAQQLLSPQAARLCASRMETGAAVERSLPKPGSASANGARGVAQKLTFSAIKKQQFKIVSPQIFRSDVSKSMQKQIQTRTQEKTKKLVQEAKSLFNSNQQVDQAGDAPQLQSNSVQPASGKPKSFLNSKIYQSPDQIASRLQSMRRGSISNTSSSVKKPGNMIRIKPNKVCYTTQSQTSLKDQPDPRRLKLTQPAQRDLADSGDQQAARQPLLDQQSAIGELQNTFLKKMRPHPRARHERNLTDYTQHADVTQSQEQAAQQVNVSNQINKRKEPIQHSLSNLHEVSISEFLQQESLSRLRARQQQSESHQHSLFVKSQLSTGKAVEGKLSTNTVEVLRMNKQSTGDEGDAASVGENKNQLSALFNQKRGESKDHKVVGTLSDLLNVFGVSNYDRNDCSFRHEGAKYVIDVRKLVLDLGASALPGRKNSAGSKLSLGSLLQFNSMSLADHEKQKISIQEIDGKGHDDLVPLERQEGWKTPIEKSILDSVLPVGASNKGIGIENPVQGSRNLLNSDRLRNNNPHALNTMQNKSQRVLAPPMQLDPEAMGHSKNSQQAAPSAGETEALGHKLNPKRMRSATNHKTCRSHDQESSGRPTSNYSKGFKQVRDQHQDRLKLSKLRSNSRQQIKQRMRSNDPKQELLQDSKSNQGSAAGSVQKQATLDQWQPPLQVKHLQTEAQSLHPSYMGIQQMAPNTKSQGLLDPNNILMPQRSQDPLATQSMANQSRAKAGNAFYAGKSFELQDGAGSHPGQSLSLLKNTESNPNTTLAEPLSSSHHQTSPNGPGQHQPDQIHLAFLFASPLMLKTSDGCYFDVLPPISFEDEFEQIKQSIEEKNIQFNYRYQVATSVNLLKILRENPVGLHFSGHGFKNTEAIYEGDKKAWKKNQNKGDVLIFENEDGSSEFFFQNDLDKMFKNVAEQLNRLNAQKDGDEAQKQDPAQKEDGGEDKQMEEIQNLEKTMEKLKDRPTNLQFVFVASCHAEKVAEIFLKIGVPHVICINQNQRILDKAAVDFSKFFYDEVFDKFCTICEAYANAKQQLENIYGPFHANKILLKTCDGHEVKNCVFKDHRQLCKQGFLNRLDEESVLNYFPNKVSPFLFRNRDMFDVLKLLTGHKIVQIFGLPGLGKSSLLKNVTVYLGERNYYKDGLIYIDLRHITTFKEALKIVSLYLNQGDDDEHDQFQMSFNPDNTFNEVVWIKRILGPLKHFMFAFDNIDHLEKNEYTNFLQFMIDLSQNTKVKFLFTSERYQPSLFQGDIGVKLLKRLTQHESVELFLTKIPLSDSDRASYFEFSNIKELHEQTAKFYKDFGIKKDLPKICSLRNCAHAFSTCVKKYLLEHPMFEFFMGTPLVISIVAPFTVCKSLKEICIDLWQRSKEQSGSADGEYIMSNEVLQGEIYYKSLLDSLDYCTKHFQEQGQGGNSPILEMWYIIGLNGPGILQDDLKAIVCAGKDQNEAMKQSEVAADEQNPFVQFEKNLEDLTKFSVIESENLDVAGRVKRLKVGPMINDYINQKIGHKFKETTIQIVCVHIRDLLVELKKKYSDNVVKCTREQQIKQLEDELADKIKLYEQQIMHLVYQAIKMDKLLEDDDKSLRTDESMEEEELRRQEEMLDGEASALEQQKGETSAQSHQPAMSSDLFSQAKQPSKSIKSASGKPRPRKQGYEVKPHVSKSFLEMRMTLKTNQINKLQGVDLEDEDAECHVDQDQDFKMFKRTKEDRAGSEILKNQVRPVRKLGPSARDNKAYKAQSNEKKGGQDHPEVEVERIFQKPEEAAHQPQDRDRDLKDSSKPGIDQDLLPIRELSDDNIVLSIKDPAEDHQADNIFGSRPEHQQDQQQGSKSPRVPITGSRRHHPLEFNNEDKRVAKRAGTTKTMEKQSSYKWSEATSEEQHYEWDQTEEGSHKNSQEGDAPEQIEEADEQDEQDSHRVKQRQRQLSSFLADHQRVMVEEEKESDTDGNHFNNTVSPFEIAKQINQQLFQEAGEEDLQSTLKRLTWKNLASRLSKEDQAPDREKQKLLRKRQNTLLKKVDQIKYDVKESVLSRIRQSVFENSFSKSNKKLINHLNPDIGRQPQEMGFEPPNEDGQRLEMISEQASSALEKDSEAKAAPVLSKNKSQKQRQDHVGHQKLATHHTQLESRLRGSTMQALIQDDAVSRSRPHVQGAPANQRSAFKEEKPISVEFEPEPSCQSTNIRHTKPRTLHIYEELFFHYLSILALIPKERPKVLVILDTFKTRNYQPQEEPASSAQNNEHRSSKKSTFNMMQSEAQKKLIDYKTIIEIPEKSKLLRANTLMLELYVQINEDMMSLMDYMNIRTGSMKQPGHFNRMLDLVYEKASEMKPFFEEIQFVRGLAVLDYVQAMRKLQRNKSIKEFKDKIKSSALRFEQAHEVCGIQQCIELAKAALRVKPAEEAEAALQAAPALKKRQLKSDSEDHEDNAKCIEALEKSLKNLTDCSDQQVQNFVRYRKENKIPNLAASLKPRRDGKKGGGQQKGGEVIHVDAVLNMLLNPQCQLARDRAGVRL